MIDNQTPHDAVEKKEAAETLLRVLNTLSTREKFVMEHLLGVDGQIFSMVEIGKMFHGLTGYNVSPTRIRQIRDRALRKLRHPSRRRYLSAVGISLECIEPERRILRIR